MKKFVFCLAVACAFAFGLTSCGSKGTCEICGKEKVPVTSVKTIAGTEKMCSTCEKAYKASEKAAKAGLDALGIEF